MKREIRLIDLTEKEFYTFDEVLIEEDHMNFAWELWFDVDKYFGTETNGYDDRWVNFYTNWYSDGHIEAMLCIDRDDGVEEKKWILLPDEQEFIRNIMTERAREIGYSSLAEMYVKEMEI